MKHIQQLLTILFVENQKVSTEFYQKLFRTEPTLNVPGMTEFTISEFCKIGLMTNKGIGTIINETLPHPSTGIGIPRCELYLLVEDVEFEYAHALTCTVKEISSVQLKDWGDRVCYFSDPDGHIIAFAEKLKK
jgi:lactoylglutathione lyase